MGFPAPEMLKFNFCTEFNISLKLLRDFTMAIIKKNGFLHIECTATGDRTKVGRNSYGNVRRNAGPCCGDNCGGWSLGAKVWTGLNVCCPIRRSQQVEILVENQGLKVFWGTYNQKEDCWFGSSRLKENASMP